MIETRNGYVHLYSKPNDSGEPTIVFLDGFGGGSSYYNYKSLWEPLSEQAPIVTIDYLGYGMSETTKADRSIDNIVSELDDALTNAGIAEPYIMVAHSLGGLYAADYSTQYPEKVQSLILLDNTVPNEVLEAGNGELEEYKQVRPLLLSLKYTGLLRLMTQNEAPGLSIEEQKSSVYFERKTLLNSTILNEIDHTAENAEYLADKKIPNSIPMLLLVSAANQEMSEAAGGAKTWLEYHEEYLNANPESTVRLVDSGHYIHYEQSDEVLQTVKTFALS
jgi:pimeloyl-ACP methyl ester carboxylesterase